MAVTFLTNEDKAELLAELDGGVYELIDTIIIGEPMLYTLTEDSKKIPYRFKRVYIGFETTNALDATGTQAGWVRFYCGDTHIGRCYNGAAGKGYYKAVEIQIEGGSWRTTWCDWGTNNTTVNSQTFSNNFDYYPDKSVINYPYIDKITIDKFAPR